jgi:DNA processing protein
MASSDEAERGAWRQLLAAQGMRVCTARKLVTALGSASAVCVAGVEQIRQCSGATLQRSRSICRAIANVDLDRERQWLAAHSGRMIGVDEPTYPRSLLEVPDPPGVLRVQGVLPPTEMPAVAVIGTRRCSPMGLRDASRFARGLVEAGCCLVSGGARGIDAEVHRMAVRCGGKTVVVLGSGLACRYPPEHHALFDAVLDQGGALISELPVHQAPRPRFFPMRNRIISGVSLGVVVIEAPERSGAMITARLAVEEHGRDAMVVPGPSDSATHAGCHRAIQHGWAHLVTSPHEVVAVLLQDSVAASRLK